MPKDLSDKIYDKLIALRIRGKAQKFVTENEASVVVGLTENNRKRTESIFKPIETCFNPRVVVGLTKNNRKSTESIFKPRETYFKPTCSSLPN